MKTIRYRFAGMAVAVLMASPACAMEFISRDDWPGIQRGIQVTQYPRLAKIVNEFDRNPDSGIVILYPGGSAGQSWAEEIRDWFVALGIPSHDIALRPGSGHPGTLVLRVDRQGLE